MAFLFVAWLSCCANPGSKDRRAASALFGEFESVFYARAGLFNSSNVTGRRSAGVTDYLRTPFWLVQSGLGWLGKDAEYGILGSGDSIIVGAKDFHAPNGLGPVVSKSCYIVVLKKGSVLDLRKYFHYAPVAVSAGSPIWNWGADLHEFGDRDAKYSSLYVTQVGFSYVVVSNDIDELQTIVRSLASDTPDAVPDWEDLSRHPVWAYRRYRYERYEQLADRDAAGMTDIMSGTAALEFSVEPQADNGVLTLIGSPASKALSARIDEGAYFPSLREVGPSRWETTFRLTGNGKARDQVFVVVGMFGFATYL